MPKERFPNEAIPSGSAEGMEVVKEEKPSDGPEELAEVAQEISESEKGVINGIRKIVNGRMEESKLPTKKGWGYESTVGVYGGKLRNDDEGRLVYDTRGVWSKIDRWGDRILRSFDEHQVRKPGTMIARRPKTFLKLLPFIVDSKRYRGTPEQAMENVHRLGLDEYYGAHPWGMEIKDPERFSHMIGLQDIFRQDQINHPEIKDIDRFEALGETAKYMRSLHEKVGGVAEANVWSFLFAKKEGNKVGEPLMIMPTEIYNPEKHVPLIEQEATELLDLMASAAIEEYRRTEDWESVRKCLRTALESYGDTKVAAMVASYIKRGRLTLGGDTEGLDFDTDAIYRNARKVFSAHNVQRLGIKNPDATAQIRSEIVAACEEFENAGPGKELA